MDARSANGDETVLMSADGYAQRCNELESLRNDERRRLSDRLREARRDGRLDDNPELVDLLEEQAQLERRIAVLEAQLACAEIVKPAADGHAGIGSLVEVRDIANGQVHEYELVGTLESDVGNGRVSIAAPVGKAVAGQRAGAFVEVATPRGPLVLEVVSVRPARPVIAKEAALTEVAARHVAYERLTAVPPNGTTGGKTRASGDTNDPATKTRRPAGGRT